MLYVPHNFPGSLHNGGRAEKVGGQEGAGGGGREEEKSERGGVVEERGQWTSQETEESRNAPASLCELNRAISIPVPSLFIDSLKPLLLVMAGVSKPVCSHRANSALCSQHTRTHTQVGQLPSSPLPLGLCEVTPAPEMLHHVLLPHSQEEVGVICWRDGGCTREGGRVFTQYHPVSQHGATFPSHIKCKHLKKASDRERIIALDLSSKPLTEPGFRVERPQCWAVSHVHNMVLPVG